MAVVFESVESSAILLIKSHNATISITVNTVAINRSVIITSFPPSS